MATEALEKTVPAPGEEIIDIGDVGKQLPDEMHVDIGWALYKEALGLDPIERDAIAKRVKRKCDWILLPLMCFIYFLSFLDKQTLNYANAYGLKSDLHLVGQQYSNIASITNAGNAIFAYPMVFALQKFPIGKFLACALLTWGTLLMCTTAVQNFAGIMTLRFLLGGAESCIAPAWMMLTGMFWTRKEQPFRMCWWLGCNGIAVMVGAGLSWGLGHTSSSIAPWRLVFLVVGILSFSAGIVAMFILPSSPGDCVWLTPEEKKVAVWRVSGNKTGIKNPKIQWYQIREAATDLKLYLVAILAFCNGVLNGSIANFGSALLSGFGFSTSKVLLYQLPTGAMEFAAVLGGGLLNSYIPGFVCISIFLGFIPGLAGMIGMATISLKHQLSLAACTWLTGTLGVTTILMWTVVATNFAGHTKRTFVNGVLFVFSSAGNITGPFLFLAKEEPRYFSAIKTLAGMFGGAMLIISLLGLMMWAENRKRSKYAVPGLVGNEEGFADKTDKENKGFWYKL